MCGERGESYYVLNVVPASSACALRGLEQASAQPNKEYTPQMSFEIHPKLLADCIYIGELYLCHVLLMNDSRFPWLILVPKAENLRDFHDLPLEQRDDLYDEIEAASKTLQVQCDAHKLNVAALGNQVPQLHIHVIGRRTDDAAWPGPVWGSGDATPYDLDELDSFCDELRVSLAIDDSED